MPVDAQDVIAARRLRHAARDVFETQKMLVKTDLGAAGVGRRVASRIADDGRKIADQASSAAGQNPPLVAVAALAVTGWLFRKPLMAFANSILGNDGSGQEDVDAPERPGDQAADVDDTPPRGARQG